jgi:hypothetical protein
MYTQNMSEKIARSVRSNLRLRTVVRISHDQRFGNFDMQEKLVSHAASRYSGCKLTPPQQQYQRLTNCVAVKTLSYIQQTQCNTRHDMAYSFSGATIL